MTSHKTETELLEMMDPDHPDFVSGLYEIKNLEYSSQVLVSYLVSWSHELQRIIDSDKGLRPALAHLSRRPGAHQQTLDQTGRMLDLFDEIGLAGTDLASSISRQLCGRIADWRKEVDALGELGLRYREAVADRDAKEKELAKRVKKEHQKKASWWPKGGSSSKKSSAAASASAEGDNSEQKRPGSSDEAAHDYLQACERVEELRARFDEEMEQVVASRSAISIDGLRAVGGCVSEFAALLDASAHRYSGAFPTLSSHLANHRSVRGGLGAIPEPIEEFHSRENRASVGDVAADMGRVLKVDSQRRPQQRGWTANFDDDQPSNEDEGAEREGAEPEEGEIDAPLSRDVSRTSVQQAPEEQAPQHFQEEQEQEAEVEAAQVVTETAAADFDEFQGTDFVAAPTPEMSDEAVAVAAASEDEHQTPTLDPPAEEVEAAPKPAEEVEEVEEAPRVESVPSEQSLNKTDAPTEATATQLCSKEVSKTSVASRQSLPGPAFAKNPFTDDAQSEYRLDCKQDSVVEFAAHQRDSTQQVFTSSPAERERVIASQAFPAASSSENVHADEPKHEQEREHEQTQPESKVEEQEEHKRESTTFSGQAQLLQPKVLPLEPQNLPREPSDQSWGDCDSIGNFHSCPSIGTDFQSCPSITTEQSAGHCIGPAE